MNIAVIGTGYVGLVAGACFAETGNYVICVDINKDRVNKLKKGIIPIFEPGLESLVKSNVEAKRLNFTFDTSKAVAQSQIVFLAVPTPMDEDGSADLYHVLNAAAEVAESINEYKVIVNKSTVPVGTAGKVKEVISKITDHPFDVVSNPEFLKEGNAVEDFMKPDRIIIGCDTPRSEAIMVELYGPFVRKRNRIISMRTTSAELTKYVANAFLATKISFINEIARLCEKVGADIEEVRSGISSDSRIGSSFLFPSMGFGGSCFPKDLRALNFMGIKKEQDLLVVQATIEANKLQKQFIPGKIRERFGENLKKLRFAVWGLAFKARTDDIRESPALTLIDFLLEGGAEVNAYDPQAMKLTEEVYGNRIEYSSEYYSSLVGADALIVATEWNEFRLPDFPRMHRIMRKPIIFDGRNLFKPQPMKEAGFEYFSIGQL